MVLFKDLPGSFDQSKMPSTSLGQAHKQISAPFLTNLRGVFPQTTVDSPERKQRGKGEFTDWHRDKITVIQILTTRLQSDFVHILLFRRSILARIPELHGYKLPSYVQ